MRISRHSGPASRIVTRLCVALTVSASWSTVGVVVSTTRAQAGAVCVTPEFFGENAAAVAIGGRAHLIGTDSGEGGFIRVANPNGGAPPTFRIDSSRLVVVRPDGSGGIIGPPLRTATTRDVLSLPQTLALNSNVVPDGQASRADSGSVSVSGGSAIPAVTTVEISNTLVEDLIRQRRELAQQEEVQVAAATSPLQPASTGSSAPSPSTSAAPSGSSQPAAAASAGSAAQVTPKKKPAAKPQQPMQPPVELPPAEIAATSPERLTGVWGQVFGDYERKRNLAPGSIDNPTRTQKTLGTVSGGDITYNRYSGVGTETLKLGVLAGAVKTDSTFTDTPNVTGARQEDDGGFVGAYAAYQFNRFALDAIFKTDILRHRERATTTRNITCDVGEVLVVDDPATDLDTVSTVSESVDKYTFTIGGNAYYRFDLSGGAWIEPVVGIRYSYTDYGSGAVFLGLADGEELRLQGGLRIGRSWDDIEGRSWTVSLLGLLYSDVVVNGFTLSGTGFTSSVSEVDEGKLRVLGQLASSVDVGGGLSFNGLVEVRGGEDLIGVGGRLGARLEW